MPLTLVCRELGFDCTFVIEGTTMVELIEQVAVHAVDAHGYATEKARSPNMAEIIRGAIRNQARPPGLRRQGPLLG